jgi:outer membrane protein TolC
MAVDEERKNVALSVAALQTAEEGRRLVKERYENALSPLTDLLDAQVSLDHARASLVSAENNYRFSVAKLGFESGTILKDLGVNE